jgi:hypothetical protein
VERNKGDGTMSMLNLLEFESYKYHRKKYSEFEPKDYRFLFADWEHYEELYQKEKTKEK